MKKNLNACFPDKESMGKIFKIMKLTTLFIILGLLHASANSYSQNARISLELKNAELREVITEIQKQTEFTFFYSPEDVKKVMNLDVKVKEAKLHEILDECLKDTDLGYEIKHKAIVLKKIPKEKQPSSVEKDTFEQPQKRTITGKVTDTKGEPLPGVTIIVKGTTTGITSDVNGIYSLEIPDDAEILVFSFVGMKSQEIVIGDQTQINVALEEETVGLEEVVAIGYGTRSKAKVINPISSIKAEALVSTPSTNAAEGMAGQLSGVQVIQASGAPGADATINIRGVGTLTAGTNPLIVIDGFPSETLSLSSLNPNSIATIDVLKDAAAAAIYGSRGSNGVIMVTTKKGKRGKLKVTYDGFIGMQDVAKKVDVQDAYERANFSAVARENMGQAPSELWQPYVDGQQGLTNTDWQNEIFRTAPIHNHSISLSGASEDVNYFVSAGYINQDGIVIGSDYERYNFRANINADISKMLRIGFNVAPSYSESNNISEGDHKGNGIILTALISNPAFAPYNEDGSLNLSGDQILGARANGLAATENVVAMALLNEDKQKKFNLLGGSFLEFEPIDGLTFRTYLGAHYLTFSRNQIHPNTVGSYKVLAKDTQATQSYGTFTSSNWISENTVTYGKTFNEDHELSVLVGHTFQTERTESTLPSALASQTVNFGGVLTTINPLYEEKWSLISYISRVNYIYKLKYIIGASFRRDGSSRFGANTKWGNFPSVSAGWRINQESFFDIEVVNDLKFRASWGITGNNSIPNYGSVPLLGTANYGTSTGLAPSTSPNADLSWEETKTLDIGLDLALFNNKLMLSADYYNALTDGLLLEVPVPAHSGNTSSLRNIGEVENKGFEFSIATNDIDLGPVKWSSAFNISSNKNEVKKLGPGQDRILEALHITQVGESLGSYYIYRMLGVFQTQEQIDNAPIHPEQGIGDYMYEDLDNDGEITANDREIAGDFFPDYTFGFSNTFKFMNFDFNFLLQGKQGFEIYNGLGFFIKNLEGWGNGSAAINDFYSESNPNAVYAHPGKHVKTYERSKLLVEDGSYIRLRNISLGYTIPKTIVKKVGIENLRVYVAAKNLFTITDYSGYNPEVNSTNTSFNNKTTTPGVDYGAYPVDRSVVFGINLSF